MRNARYLSLILCQVMLTAFSMSQPNTVSAQSKWYEVYFSQVHNDVVAAKANPQSLDRILVQKLGLAETRIDAALHEVDSDRIAAALIRAHERGVRVRLVTEHDYIDELSIEELREAGVPIVSDEGRSGLMHNKFIVIDGRYVWTGSFNTTDNGAFKNNNNAIWLDSTEVAENYTRAFLDMFELRQFGGKSRSSVPHPVVSMPDGTTIRTAFAPDYDVARFIVNEIRQAEQSAYFMAFSFTHDAMGKAIRDQFTAGVDVRGVFETRGADTRYSELASMRELGMPVMKDTNKWAMHHKVLILDGQTVITGSFNFSRNAARSNDENVLLIRGNTDIAQQYTEEFQRIFGSGPAAESPAQPDPVVVVASSTDSGADSSVSVNSPTESVADAFNVNTATQAQLEDLPGIGPALAKRIIEGRPYSSLQDLQRVRGLGVRKIAALRALVGFE